MSQEILSVSTYTPTISDYSKIEVTYMWLSTKYGPWKYFVWFGQYVLKSMNSFATFKNRRLHINIQISEFDFKKEKKNRLESHNLYSVIAKI